MSDSTVSSPRPSLASIAVAIVVAGALIAIAIFFSGPIGYSFLGKTPQAAPAPSPAEAGPEEPVVGNIRPVTEQDHVRGTGQADVTIIEYSDLECPFCKQFHQTLAQVMQDYPNDVRWVYRHFPLAQIHSQAEKEAMATECAAEQGKFWELTDKIFAVTPANNGLNLADLPKLAREAGVANITQFEACLAANKYADRIQADLADAQVAGGQGTPHTVLLTADGQKVPLIGAQPLPTVKAEIDKLLK